MVNDFGRRFRNYKSRYVDEPIEFLKGLDFMSRTLILSILIFVCFLSLSARAQDDSIAKRFVGGWKLVSVEGEDPIFPLGYDHPSGMIIYDASGWMSGQIAVKGDRKSFVKGLRSGTTEEKAAAFDSYFAYYGTYTVDPEKKTVTHHVENHSWPGLHGVDNVRWFEFEGDDRLILIPVGDGKGRMIERDKATYKLVWQRVNK
jgi:Lipocalin-like domain